MNEYNCIKKELSSFNDVLYYQVDVIRHNPDLPIFLPSLKLKEDIPCLEINTKGYISFEEWLLKNNPAKSMVIKILELYFNALISCNEYFLDAKNFAPGFSGLYVSLSNDLYHCFKEDIKLVYYPIVENDNSEFDPLKIFGEEMVIHFEKLAPGLLSENEIIFLDNLNISEIVVLYQKFKQTFIVCNNPDSNSGPLNLLKCKLSEIFDSIKSISRIICDKDFHFQSKNLKETSNKSESAFQKMIFKDSFIIPAIVIAQVFLLVISFLIVKNQIYYKNSAWPVAAVSVFITLCFLMDFWLLFSYKSPLKIKSLIFSSSDNSTKTLEETIPKANFFSTAGYEYSAKLTSKPLDCNEYPDCEKYYILTEDFLIGSDKIRTDMYLKYPNIDDMHARITCKQGFYFIEDLGSQSGTFLNDTRLKKYMEYKLDKSAKVRFGNAVFYFTMNS